MAKAKTIKWFIIKKVQKVDTINLFVPLWAFLGTNTYTS